MQKSDWKKCKLGDVATTTTTKISCSDITSNYISTENMLPDKGGIVAASSLPNSGNVSIYHKGDVLVSNIRPYFKKIWHAPVDGAVSNDVIVFHANEGVNSRYLYYTLADDNFFAYVMTGAKGTKMPRGDKKQMLQYPVNLPPLEEQKRIAEILGSLDDKIELLQKQNKTLEDMAKALFKSWFVDFDVVRAKQKGLPKADIMREYHLTDELYDLFPSSFAVSPLGPIPSGWEVKNVGELLAFSIGGGWGNEEESESFPIKAPVIRGTDIPSLRSSGAYNDVPVRFHKKSNHTSRELKEGDIVLEVAGGSKGQPVGRALFVSDYIIKSLPKVICASFCKLLRPNKKLLLSELFYLYLDMMYQTGEIEQYQVQSTGISNFQFKQFCEDKQFVIPNTELQKKLSLNVYIDKIGNNKKQIQTLTELRDTLLPRLISGKIRV